MDAFILRQRILDDYSAYVRSFLNIRDDSIRAFVEEQLTGGALWPEPLLQLNPAYAPGRNIADMVAPAATGEGAQGGEGLHPLCGRLFASDGHPFDLYCHQERAIHLAAQRQPYVLTTGTGSGKSLTYFVPIIDHVLKNDPDRHSVRAIVVYPMNALINSQLESLERLAANVTDPATGPGQAFPVRFARYTGQETLERKQEILEDPPHLLLTNYVMLELMLTRPSERVFVDRAVAELEFLVLDELHTYSGRQGADVAMLVRRLRQRCGNPHLLCIGTSATMVAGGSRQQRLDKVSQVASRLFGVPVSPEHVIDETLLPATQDGSGLTGPGIGGETEGDTALPHMALRQAVESGIHATRYQEFSQHPIATWIERTFRLQDEDGHLRRRPPITLAEGADRLSQETGLDVARCRACLEQALEAGNRARTPRGEPIFAFKLHQFISQGGSVYTTLETQERRYLTLGGQTYAPGGEGERPLYPLHFCRECGQEYLSGRLVMSSDHLSDGVFKGVASQESDEGEEGYLLIEDPAHPVWDQSRVEDLPETWFRQTKRRGRVVNREYESCIPRRLWTRADGRVRTSPPRSAGTPAPHLDDESHGDHHSASGWFIPAPFLTCLNCGVVYTRHPQEFRKLARLSSEGRSTATTLLGLSAIASLRDQPAVDPEAQKLLSFTDNRQDASLQAGHFNDFVQVALLRAATYRALPEDGSPLDHTTIAQAVFKALDLPQGTFAQEAAEYGPARRRNQKALQALLEYRVYEDLRRGWRVVQPNLEQSGLLRVAYPDLDDLCRDASAWRDHPILAAASPETRQRATCAFLDHLRRELAIDALCLDADE